MININQYLDRYYLMRKLVYYSLKKKHNSNQLTYGKLKVNQIIMKDKTKISNTFYEDYDLDMLLEYLNKLYLKKISRLLFNKICLFHSIKKDQNLIPIFKDLYWSNYMIDYYEIKFDLVNLKTLNSCDNVDANAEIFYKPFFDTERIEEIEKEYFIQYETIASVGKRDNKEKNQSNKDIVKFISWLDYESKLADVKRNEKKRMTVHILEVKNDNTMKFRKLESKKFGGLKMMKSKKIEELNVIVKEAEKNAVLRLSNPIIKPIQKSISKFKSIKDFKKLKNEKNNIKKAIEVQIKKTLNYIYASKGFEVGDIILEQFTSPRTKNKSIFHSVNLSRNINNFKTFSNDSHFFNLDKTDVSIKKYRYENNKELFYPKVNTSRMTLNETNKTEGFISLKKSQVQTKLDLTKRTETKKFNFINYFNAKFITNLKSTRATNLIAKTNKIDKVMLLKGDNMKC